MILKIFGGTILLTLMMSLPASSNEELQAKLKASFLTLLSTPASDLHTGLIPEELDPLTPYFRHFNLKEPKRIGPEVRDLACTGCIAAIDVLIDLFMLGVDIETIEEAVLEICDLFNIEDRDVCHGAIWNYAPQLEYIFSQRRVHGNEVCAILLGNGCGKADEINSWTVDLPSVTKPEVVSPAPPAPGSPTKKILQLSDVHLDLSYEIGALAACDLPNCCMSWLGQPQNSEDAAQYWGDYRCDLPQWTFRHILEHIRDNFYDEIEYVIITGDYPAHDVWLQSREGNLAHTKTAVDLVKEMLPDKMVLPSMGNHESFPCNNYPTSGVEGYDNPDWLYSTLGEYFSGWLPEEQLAQFRIDGYYSMNIGTDFKIIGINSNMCLTYNFFLFLEWEDPSHELAWLVDELLLAEVEGRKVHILSHIPPGNGDCLGAWGREFTKIINRFENTVTGQFYGHTHNDEFAVFFDGDRATNIGFITPSITTYTGLNPAFRLYTIDSGYEGASYRVLDHDTYVFNMTAANEAGPDVLPAWYKLYSAKQDLDLQNLFPEDFHNLVLRLAEDDDFYWKFVRYWNQDASGEGRGEVEDKKPILCPMVTTTNLDKTKCDEIFGANK